jgi:hypothetical protein
VMFVSCCGSHMLMLRTIPGPLGSCRFCHFRATSTIAERKGSKPLVLMPRNVHFIVSTGDISIDVKKAHGRNVRSHVTRQHYREKRDNEVQKFQACKTSAREAQFHSTATLLTETTGTREISKEVTSLEQPEKLPSRHPPLGNGAVRLGDDSPTLDHRLKKSDYSSISPADGLSHENYFHSASDHKSILFTQLGQGANDPFIQLPSTLTQPMRKHLNYCKVTLNYRP